MKSDEVEKWQKVRSIWDIIHQLRGESGCPWDRKQTPGSLQAYLLEESHEAAAAIRGERHEEVCEELGDLLFMVLFLVYLYEETDRFALEDVCDRICEKMVRRHPHVFGNLTVESSQEVMDNWEKIKAGEKKSQKNKMDAVPASLPALLRAHRMVSRLKGQEKDAWNDVPFRARQLAARSDEVAGLVENGKEVKPEIIGDMLLELVNLARVNGYRAEDCLHRRLMNWKDGAGGRGNE